MVAKAEALLSVEMDGEVKSEFGARSTGESSRPTPMVWDAAPPTWLKVDFPAAELCVMRIERTWLNKAKAAHVNCLQGRLRGQRFALHWHDLERLDSAGLAEGAIANREITNAIAAHTAFECSSQLVPEGHSFASSED